MEVDKALLTFCFMTKNTLQNKFLKLEQGDIEKIEMAVGRTLKYLDTHQLRTNLSPKRQRCEAFQDGWGLPLRPQLWSSRFTPAEAGTPAWVNHP